MIDSTAARIRFVLVGTQHPGNIGAAARALKTMGLAQLVLVSPAKYPDEEALRRAAGADDLLGDAIVTSDLATAVADCQLVLGCTARNRRIQLHEHTPREAAEKLVKSAQTGSVALLFGRERTGLTNEELQLCHAAVHIDANPEYSSLNLAAAVQILAYEVRLALKDLSASSAQLAHGDSLKVLATHSQMEGFFTQLAQILELVDFHKGRAPESAMRKLRRLYLRAILEEKEVRLLRGILTDCQRMLRLAGKNDGVELSHRGKVR